MGIFDDGTAERLVGTALPESHRRWLPSDVILYHLGVGIGIEDPDVRLDYLDEARLVVLPTFAATVAHATGASFHAVPGLAAYRGRSLHGEQQIRLHVPIPVEADTVTRGFIAGVKDLGSSALVDIETETLTMAGEPLFGTRFGIVLRGAGDHGGIKASSQQVQSPPSRTPDVHLSVRTSRRQAAIYRLSGDRNPLHLDPEAALAAGFDRPILHGLSTYGAVMAAVVDGALDGDVTQVTDFSARFAKPVYPGDDVDVLVWRSDGVLLVEALVRARDVRVLTNAIVDLRP